jgi:hypothetical protein
MHFAANALKSGGLLIRIIDSGHELMHRVKVGGVRCNSVFAPELEKS